MQAYQSLKLESVVRDDGEGCTKQFYVTQYVLACESAEMQACQSLKLESVVRDDG